MSRVRGVLLGLGLAAVTCGVGCGSAMYVYAPEENATARVADKPAALYRIPFQSPRGDVRIATLGIATLQLHERGGEHVQAMHVRMVVDNDDDVTAWQLDTREQLGSLDRFGESRPVFASSSVGRPPLVSVPPRGSVTVDLFYPLPASLQKASEIPHFDVLWRVETAEGAVATRTSFERLQVEPLAPVGHYTQQVATWGWKRGWVDPTWQDQSFHGAPGIAERQPASPGGR